MENSKRITFTLHVDIPNEVLERIYPTIQQPNISELASTAIAMLSNIGNNIESKTPLNQTESTQKSTETANVGECTTEVVNEVKTPRKRTTKKELAKEEVVNGVTETQEAEQTNESPFKDAKEDTPTVENEQQTEIQESPKDYITKLRELVALKDDGAGEPNRASIREFYSSIGVSGTSSVPADKYFDTLNYLNTLEDAKK